MCPVMWGLDGDARGELHGSEHHQHCCRLKSERGYARNPSTKGGHQDQEFETWAPVVDSAVCGGHIFLNMLSK